MQKGSSRLHRDGYPMFSQIHNIIGSNLHREADDMDENERMESMFEWKTIAHQIIEDEGISPERLYNVDQTGLYYTKLPNKVVH
jgi:hypothetical protein